MKTSPYALGILTTTRGSAMMRTYGISNSFSVMTPKCDHLPGFSANLSKFYATSTLKFSSFCPQTMDGSLDDNLGNLPGIPSISLGEWGTIGQRDYSYTRSISAGKLLVSKARHCPLV